jgi:dethiobiotin synthetase
MNSTYFITGISTDVGKTVVSAIITEALQADYWKPIQAGELENTDRMKVEHWVTNPKSKFHDSVFDLKTPMSPHAAAQIDNVKIRLKNIVRPETKNTLVIEGAGGLLVPLNNSEMVIDLIHPADRVILVSRHYLGSINHTLLSIEALQKRKLKVFGIIFVGNEHPTTESVIAKIGSVPVLGRIDEEPYIDHHVVSEYAEILKTSLTEKQK